MLVDHYDEDWSTLWWVRVRGRAEVIEAGAGRDAERHGAVAALVAKYEQYRDRPPGGAVISITISELRTWSA